MAKKPTQHAEPQGSAHVFSSTDELMAAALERGGDTLQTGRYLVTFKDGAGEEGIKSLKDQGMRIADARDFGAQSMTAQSAGDADALYFNEIGVALVGRDAFEQRSMSIHDEIASDSPVSIIEPEYFMFADDVPEDYLRGFMRAVETIANDLGRGAIQRSGEAEFDPAVLGNTWGLIKCKVPPSVRSGVGIRVAVLDTGFDLGHPDFAGRIITSQTFVGQPVQDLNGHGTHTAGTACGPQAPAGAIPRYGIAYRGQMFIGKVLTNAGSGTTATVLAGMNWAIANKCAVISMSLGSQSPVQAAFTAAGSAALANGCLIIAAAGNAAAATGAPANSPTIMAVASLDQTLVPSSFSDFGKIEIAGPGRDVYSSVPRPILHGIKSGTSMACPHVAGCAALWAETSPNMRGMVLWNKLLASALALPFPPARVGRGLVQAP